MFDRRTVLKGASAVPLAAILADPVLAATVAGGLDTVEITTADGRAVRASLALPQTMPAPAVLLVHEWWGLNDQIRSVAAELAKEGYVALAVDLMDGKVATTAEDASAQMNAVKPEEATETLKAWVAWLRANDRVNDKIGTVGWCFGGGWSLNAGLAAPVEATVVYYGWVPGDPAVLMALEGPVLGHFATQDTFINKDMVDAFEAGMKEAGQPLDLYWYEANHAFANPTGANYDSEDAKLSWARTLAFLKANLG